MANLMKFIASVLFLLAFSQPAYAQKADGDDFMRIVYDEANKPQSMQTSVLSYTPTKESPYQGVTVDMISAVHVGEGNYFKELNKVFDNYDALLYELIAEKGTIPQADPNRTPSMIASMQLGLTEILQLEYQLHGINYQKPHFVHADKSPDEFMQSMRDNNESFFSLFMKLLSVSYEEQARNPSTRATEAKLMLAMLSNDPVDRARRLKRLMASQFRQSDLMIKALNGEQGSTIIAGRNDTALEVLKQQIKAGKKRIGVYYGAGHMPDFHEKLKRDFGLKSGTPRWIEAWNLR